jgi:hypothetical protein
MEGLVSLKYNLLRTGYALQSLGISDYLKRTEANTPFDSNRAWI